MAIVDDLWAASRGRLSIQDVLARHGFHGPLVARRGARHTWFSTLEPPMEWQGLPPRVPRCLADTSAEVAEGHQLSGIGVTGGIVEGTARVLHTPDFEDVAPNEILFAPTTDPISASSMFISRGLVVDVRGALSHAAVVARELGIPSVVNTRTGTRDLRTGDVLRVDHTTGRVDVLSRA